MDFTVKGTVKAGQKWEHFSKKVTSQNKKNAMDKAYSLIGSEHGLERRLIKIVGAEEVKA